MPPHLTTTAFSFFRRRQGIQGLETKPKTTIERPDVLATMRGGNKGACGGQKKLGPITADNGSALHRKQQFVEGSTGFVYRSTAATQFFSHKFGKKSSCGNGDSSRLARFDPHTVAKRCQRQRADTCQRRKGVMQGCFTLPRIEQAPHLSGKKNACSELPLPTAEALNRQQH